MLNKNGQIEVRVGFTFSDGENEYRAIRPRACFLCCFQHKDICPVLACYGYERKDSMGVHFIKEGGKKCK